MKSGKHLAVDSGFQSPGFRIQQANISWIPESLKMGEITPLTCMLSNGETSLLKTHDFAELFSIAHISSSVIFMQVSDN